MLEKSITERILGWFFRNPRTETGLRELSRVVGASLPSVSSTIALLEKEGLVLVKTRRPVAKVIANAKNIRFTRKKRLHNLETLYESGIIDALRTKYPQTPAIVCFGSYATGEDDERSDIDIAIIAPTSETFDVRAYEKKIGKTIQIIGIFPTTNENLKENVRNGVIMDGAL